MICFCFACLAVMVHFVSGILGFGNAHTSVSATLTLRFPNKNVQAHFCLETLVMFHVKHAMASVAMGCLHTIMTEREHVGLWHSHSPNVSELAPKEQTCDGMAIVPT